MTKVNDYEHYAALRQLALKKGTKNSHRFVEKPAMESILVDLTGMRILLLGCGTGEETLLLEKYGAKDMVGVDISKESVRLANETYPAHKFFVGDMHELNFPDMYFDFVYSSLTIHHSDNPLVVYEEISRVLKPGGKLQFSVGHPARWASDRINIDGAPTKVLGYSEAEDHPQLYGSYSQFAVYEEIFPSGEVLSFWVGPPSMHFALLKQAGFTVEEFLETKAVPESKSVDPYYFERFSNFPQFTVFAAKKG